MTFDMISGILRHLLTTGAGMLAANGYLQQDQTQQFIAAGMFFAGIAFSAVNKLLHKKQVQQAITQAKGV